MLKCTMLFGQSSNKSASVAAQVRVGGWSESWYVDTTITEARSRFNVVMDARAALLSNSATIIGQRYQMIGGGSQSGGLVKPGRAGVLADVPQMALMITTPGDGVLNIKRTVLRGIPDVIVYEGEYKPDASYNQLLPLFFRSLIQGGFRFHGKDLGATPTQVVSVSSTGVFVLAADMTYSVGSYLTFTRTNNQVGFPITGNWLVDQKTDARNGRVALWDTYPVSGGQVKVVGNPVYPAVGADWQVARIVVRKVGRPFNQYRGRRSKKR